MSPCSCQNPLILIGVIQESERKVNNVSTPAATNPILRRIHKSKNSLLRNSGPLFPQKPSKVLQCAVLIQTCRHSSPKDVLSMLNARQIWQNCRPCHSVHIVPVYEVIHNTRSMRCGIVILEYWVRDWHLTQEWQHMGR